MIRQYSVDTSTCIDLIRGRNTRTRQHFTQAIDGGRPVNLCSVALHELWFGAAKSQNPERSRNALEILLSGVVVLDFDGEDALTAGEIRAHLAGIGKSIGPFDTLIAAQALRRGLTIVTDNVREFKRVPGLVVESWSKRCRGCTEPESSVS